MDILKFASIITGIIIITAVTFSCSVSQRNGHRDETVSQLESQGYTDINLEANWGMWCPYDTVNAFGFTAVSVFEKQVEGQACCESWRGCHLQIW
jgi:hypothetical protein